MAGRLRWEHPEDQTQPVGHETLYPYLYAHPAGARKRVLVTPCHKGTPNAAPAAVGRIDARALVEPRRLVFKVIESECATDMKRA
ncbi:hypothetical protein B2A_09719 [mine drainage metagenome]|uniref:Uncharacterized protein n=1 Tax=mine drainage metagenome TaxID=410659 RepID=T0ZI43_9ZZZZ